MKKCTKCKKEKKLNEFYFFNKKIDNKRLRTICKYCQYSLNRIFHKRNPDFHTEYMRKWRKENPDKTKEILKKYKSSEKYKNYMKKWYEKRYEKWYEKNRMKVCERNRQWRQNNKEKWSLINRAQRHRRRALGKINYQEWLKKIKDCGNMCLFCKAMGKLTIDHIIPVSKGGTNSIDNLQPLCLSCNIKKSDKVKL